MNTLDTLTEFLLQHARTVTCAESCTGGLLAAEFTRTSGSSAWFDMGLSPTAMPPKRSCWAYTKPRWLFTAR